MATTTEPICVLCGNPHQLQEESRGRNNLCLTTFCTEVLNLGDEDGKLVKDLPDDVDICEDCNLTLRTVVQDRREAIKGERRLKELLPQIKMMVSELTTLKRLVTWVVNDAKPITELVSKSNLGMDGNDVIAVAKRKMLKVESGFAIYNRELNQRLESALELERFFDSSLLFKILASDAPQPVTVNPNAEVEEVEIQEKQSVQQAVCKEELQRKRLPRFRKLRTVAVNKSNEGTSTRVISGRMGVSSNAYTNGKLFQCKDCVYSCGSITHLKRHLVVHCQDGKPFSCDLCKSKSFFMTRHGLKKHLACVHLVGRNEEKIKGLRDNDQEITISQKGSESNTLYMCKLCKKKFSLRGNAKKHIEHVHWKKNTFTCGKCPRSFTNKLEFMDHNRHHCKEKPLECKECQKRFRNFQGLKRHLGTEHFGTVQENIDAELKLDGNKNKPHVPPPS